MADIDDKLDRLADSLDRFTATMLNLGGAGQSLATNLKNGAASLTNFSRTVKTANDVERLAIDYERQRSEAMRSAARQVGQAFGNLVKQTISLSSATMGAQGAFTSLAPAINLTVDTITKLAEAAATAGSAIPFIGGLGVAAAKTLKVGLDLANQVVQFQLNNAQRVADSFVNLSQQGTSFGGSINSMIASAAAANVSLETFAKTVNNNVQALVGMGGEAGRNAMLIATMGRRIGDTNDRLLAQYGSFDQLNQGIIDYISLQNAAGIDEIRRNQNLGKTVEDYLIRQREITALTGKRAEELKKEEEARRRQIAFASLLNDLGPEARENLREAFAQVGKFGPEFQTYLQQYLISQRTGIVSREMILLENFLGPAAGAVREIAGSINSSKDAFRTLSTDIITNAAPAARQAALGLETFGALAQAGYGSDIVKFLADAAGSLNASFTAANSAAQQAKDLAKNQLVDLTTATRGFADATRSLEQRRITLDQAALESMTNFQYLVDFGTMMQERMIAATRDMSAIVNALANGDMKKLQEAIDRFAYTVLRIRIGGAMQPDAPGTSGGIIIDESSIAAAGGAVLSGPESGYKPNLTMHGTEAIIPLDQGNVPMEIDWTPMVRAIQVLTAKVEETNDINRRILDTSY